MTAKKVKIIAEAGVNHNGSLQSALQLVEIAAEAGVDAVKFQTFNASSLVTYNAPKADYQKETTGDGSTQLEMLSNLQLSRADHQKIIARCEKLGIQFLSSAFDISSFHLLYNDLLLREIKFGSGEITNAPLLFEAAKSDCNIILSTGMSDLGDIEAALGILAFGMLTSDSFPKGIKDFRHILTNSNAWKILKKRVSLLHCTSEYPAPFKDCNLQVISVLESSFGLEVGYSDHTKGIGICLAAVARGASIIEKHFTIDRTLVGPDHSSSIEGDELKNLVVGIRQIELSLGNGIKQPQPSDLKNKTKVRKSLVAEKSIKKGEKFSENNLTVKRPGTGISPIYYWDFIGKVAHKDYSQDEPIEAEMFLK